MKLLSKLVILTLLVATVGFFPMPDANAAGVTVYADLNPDTNYNSASTTPSTVEAWPEIATSATDEVYISWVASNKEYLSGETITIYHPTGWTFANNCSTPTTQVGLDGTGSAVIDGSGDYVYTFNDATAGIGNSGLEFCINVTADANAGNVAVDISDSQVANDFGSVLLYNGNDNDVLVTADVGVSLTFAIRTNDDTTDTNACDLGTLTTAAVGSCSYRLKVSTNASDGYLVRINSNGDLLKAGSGDVLDPDDIDKITEDGAGALGTVTAGTEGYGAKLLAGSATNGNVTETSPWNDDDTPIPYDTTGDIGEQMYASDGANVPGATDGTNTALVTHNAAIDSYTETGNYTQTVSYMVTARY